MSLLKRTYWRLFSGGNLERRRGEFAAHMIHRLLNKTLGQARQAARSGRLVGTQVADEFETLLYISDKLHGSFNFPRQEYEAAFAKASGDADREIKALRKHCAVSRRLIRICHPTHPDQVDTGIFLFEKTARRLKKLAPRIEQRERALLKRLLAELKQ